MTRVLYLDESGTPGSPKSRGADGLYHLGVGCVATVDAAAAAKAWLEYAPLNLPTTDGGTWADDAFPLARKAIDVIGQSLAPAELRSLLFVDDTDSFRAALNRGIERDLVGREPLRKKQKRVRRR